MLLCTMGPSLGTRIIGESPVKHREPRETNTSVLLSYEALELDPKGFKVRVWAMSQPVQISSDVQTVHTMIVPIGTAAVFTLDNLW